MAAHTALVEACDWDESQADAVLQTTADFLSNLKPAKETTWIEFRNGISQYLNRIYGKQITDIIINILETKANEIKYYMELQND